MSRVRVEPADAPVRVVFTVELSNGHFKSQISAPFPIPEAERGKIVEQWLDLMAAGLRMGALKLDAELPAGEAK